MTNKPEKSSVEKMVENGRLEQATEEVRKLVNNPNTPPAYIPGINPTLKGKTPPPGMSRIHGEEIF